MRRFRMIVALLAVVLVLPLAMGSASADGHRDPSALVDRMLVAIAGEDRLVGVETVQIEASGTRWILDEGIRPGDGKGVPGDYDLTTRLALPGGDMRLDYAIDNSRFGPRAITEVFDGTGGFIDGQNSVVAPPGAAAMGGDRWISVATHQLLMNPHLLVNRMATGVSPVTFDRSVRLGGQRHDVLIVERVFGRPLKVVVNWRTGLIKRIEVMESDPLRRDVALVVRFGHYDLADGGLVVPSQILITYDGELVHREFRSGVRVNAGFPEGIFDPPAGVGQTVLDPVLLARGANNHQHLQSFAALGFPLDGLQTVVTSTELSPGVHWLSGGTHHSMVVEHDGGLILVDAPRSDHRARAILDHIAVEFPDEPITHLVQSHHHVDHAAGARTIIATGADLVVQRSGRQLWSRILRAESTVVPDVAPVTGVAARIQTVTDGGSGVFGSGPNAVQVHSFDQTHADDLVLVVAGGVAFIVDYYNPFPGAPLPPEGRVVLDVIAERGLDVHTIAGGHGGFVAVEGLG